MRRLKFMKVFDLTTKQELTHTSGMRSANELVSYAVWPIPNCQPCLKGGYATITSITGSCLTRCLARACTKKGNNHGNCKWREQKNK